MAVHPDSLSSDDPWFILNIIEYASQKHQSIAAKIGIILLIFSDQSTLLESGENGLPDESIRLW